jgi:hypothetical protein
MPFVKKMPKDTNEILSFEYYTKALCRFDSWHDSIDTVMHLLVKKKSRRNDIPENLRERAKSLYDRK